MGRGSAGNRTRTRTRPRSHSQGLRFTRMPVDGLQWCAPACRRRRSIQERSGSGVRPGRQGKSPGGAPLLLFLKDPELVLVRVGRIRKPGSELGDLSVDPAVA